MRRGRDDVSRRMSQWPAHPVTSGLAMLVTGLASGIVWNRFTGDLVFSTLLPILTISFRETIRTRFGISVLLMAACATVGFSLGCCRHEQSCRRLSSNDVRRWVATPRPRLLSVRGILIAREDRAPPGPQDRPTSQCIVRSSAIGGQGGWVACTGDLLVQALTDDASVCEPGRAVILSGWLEPVPEALNPGERSPRQFWNSRGVVAQTDLRSRGIIRPDPETPAVSWRIWREKVRAAARQAIRNSVPERSVGLVESIVLGIRDKLSTSDREAFRDTGTIHLLAISGLHLQAVALFVLLVSRRAGIRPEVASIGVVAFTCIYALIVTGGASVLRATVMALAMASSTVWQRPGDFRHRFVLAGAIVLCVNPGDLFDPGAQLSFLGTLALVAASRNAARSEPDQAGFDIERWIFTGVGAAHGEGNESQSRLGFAAGSILAAALRWLGAGIIVSTLVWAVTAPLVAFHFGAVNPVAIIMNLPLVPLTSFALIAGLTGLALDGLGLAWAALPALSASGQAMNLCVASLDQALIHGSGPWPFDSLTTFSVTAFYALAFAFWMSPVARTLPVPDATRFAWAVPPSFLIVASAATSFWYSRPPASPEVEMLAVDHGLAVLVRWPDGQNWLYDCGRMGQPAVGRNIVAPALRARGVHRLDTVFVSHADADHYNGLESMIDAGIRVDRLVSSRRFFTSTQPDTQALIDYLRRRNVRFSTVASGEFLRRDAHGSARVLLPDADSELSRGTDNAESLVIELSAAGFRLLLTGDLEGDGLRRLVDRHASGPDAQPYDAVTAPHHGGLASNPAWFYEALRPRLVLSSQAKNRFGQATGLQAQIDEYCPGALLYTTSTDGAVRIRWSPQGVFVSGFAPGSGSARLAPARPAPERGRARTAEMVLNP